MCDSISATYSRGADMVVLINTSDVLDGKFLNRERVPNKDLKGQFKKTFQRDDILYSEIRPANKRFAYVDFDAIDYIASTKLMVLRAKPNVNPRFLYHILKSEDTLEKLQMLAESRSGTFPQITYSEMANVSVLLPDRATQDKIVAILSSLDDKIENNNRINANLEAQAQALFKSWFVDFEPFGGTMPEDWREGTLGEIADITMGQSPRGESYNTQGEGVIFYQGCSDFGDRFPSVRMFTTEPARYAVSNSILMSVRAPVGTMNVALEECCIGRGLASLKEKNGYDSFLLYLLESLQNVFDSYNGDGTVFGSINKKSIGNIKIIIPSYEVVESFHKMVYPLDKKIKFNHQESARLAALRDTLLPKLMKGEIEV